MHNKLKTFLLLFFCLSTYNFIKAQDLDNTLQQYKAFDPQEKIFIHYDKSFYNPGETVWFKAYLTSGGLWTTVSKNFYAELLNEKGVLLDKVSAPIVYGGANSYLKIDSNYKSQKVFVRAYTVNSFNSDTAFIYTKALTIIQPTYKPYDKNLAKTVVDFLPEGGSLVEGIEGNVAFKAYDNGEGQPVTISGVVKNSKGGTVAKIETLYDGMGQFLLTPEGNETYTAFWSEKNKPEQKTVLPAAGKTGITLKLEYAEGKIVYKLNRREDADESLKSLSIVAVKGFNSLYEAKVNFSSKTQIRSSISVDDLSSGVVRVTVFNSEMKPLAERICFVNNGNFELDGDAWLSTVTFDKRGQNRVEVKVNDTTLANLSLSITDADLDAPESNLQDNIVSRMLLTGELKGKVYNPYYYFYSTSDSAKYHLDLVMLTNGWRKFNWNTIISGNIPAPKYIENDYLGFKGNIIAPKGFAGNGLQLTGMMQTTDSARDIIVIPVDRDGNINTSGMVFFDSARLYLNFNDKNKAFEPSMLNLNNGLMQTTDNSGISNGIKKIPFNVDPDYVIRNSKVNKDAFNVAKQIYKDGSTLENVTVVGKTKTNLQKLDERYASGMFSGGFGKQFDLVNDPFAAGSLNVFQYLQGKVAGLQITTNGMDASLSWRGGTPSLYLNEMMVDQQSVSSLSMADIAYIKTFAPGEAGVIGGGGGGVIAIYTKKGGDGVVSSDSRIKVVKINGYTALKEFYSPDYLNPDGKELYEDLRKTILWVPNLFLNKQNSFRSRIIFYNNDITKRFRVVLEGINVYGKLIHVEKVIEK